MIGLDAWWDEPVYKAAQVTFGQRGAFILAKLLEHDAAKLREVLDDLYRADVPGPEDIGRFEWATILRYLRATPEEIADVQQRMGRVWR
jgi:hypothetical protein